MSTHVREAIVPLAKTMRAAAIERFGGPEVLQIKTLPVPELDPSDVLIAVYTAGVGGWDADIRDGWSPGGKPLHLPLVLGSDGAGVIVAVGSRIRRFEVGDKVYAYSWNNPKGGFYAEYVAVDAGMVAHEPKALDLEHAGAVPVTGLTALKGIDQALRVQPEETLIVHGATGGVGTIALQLAKRRGARVLATASGKDGLALVRKLGADAAVDGHHEDIAAAAHRFAPDGVDAVLALAGGEALEQCLEALRPGGRLAYPHGIEPEPKKRRGIEVVGYDASPGSHELEHLGETLEAGSIEVPIAAEYPLEEAAKAHERLAKGHVLGKIVLQVHA